MNKRTTFESKVFDNTKYADLTFLDGINSQMTEDPDKLAEHFSLLVRWLFDLRQSLDESGWKQLIPQITSHPIKSILYQDPFTLRCFQKPRGYAGDAVLLDYVYDCIPPDDITKTGKAIFVHATKNHPGCQGVRYRRAYLTHVMDEMAIHRDNLKILSVACGHLREAETSRIVEEGKFEIYMALDQDVESLRYIERSQYAPRIRTVKAKVRNILVGEFRPDIKFDLVYAAGLYDYLEDEIAQQLTKRLFELLDFGGKLVIPNLSNMPDTGYMESFMDWHLIYRDEPEMHEMYARVPESEIDKVLTFFAPNKTVVFLEIDKVS